MTHMSQRDYDVMIKHIVIRDHPIKLQKEKKILRSFSGALKLVKYFGKNRFLVLNGPLHGQ